MSDRQTPSRLMVYCSVVFVAGLVFYAAAEVWLVASLPAGRPWGGPDEPIHLSVISYMAENLGWPSWDNPQLIRYQNGVSYATSPSLNYWIEALFVRLTGRSRISSMLLFTGCLAGLVLAFRKSRLAGMVGLAALLPQVLFIFAYVSAEPWTALIALLLGFAVVRFRNNPTQTANVVLLFTAAGACMTCRYHLWALGLVAFLYALVPESTLVLRAKSKALLLALVPALAIASWWPVTSYMANDGDPLGYAATKWSQERFGDPVALSYARSWDEFPVEMFARYTTQSFYGLWGWINIWLPLEIYVAALLVGGPLLIALWVVQKRFVPLYVLLFGANLGLMLVYSTSYDFQPQGRYLFPSYFLMLGVMLQDFSSRLRLESLGPRLQWVLAAWLTAFVALNAYSITQLGSEVRRLRTAHFETAVKMLKYGRLESARRLFEQAVEDDPRNVRAYQGLGHVLSEQGKLNEAVKQFRKAVEINPELVSARLSLGSAYLGIEQIDAAIEEFREAVRVAPHSAEAHYHLAVGYAERGDTQSAIRHCKKVIELQGSHEKAKRLYRELLD